MIEAASTSVGGYLDAASAAPLHPAARQALLAALDDGWADPARLYSAARRARLLLDAARDSLAADLGARPDELSFTPSGTVAAHLAILGGLAGRRRLGRLLVHSAVEHSCVLHAADTHVAAGGAVAVLAVDRTGQIDPDDVRRVLADRADAALVSVQGGSHEVGTVQPLDQVAAACAARGVPLHVDAAQSAPWGVPEPGWSLLTASARKWGGPPGVGVLAVRTGTRWRSPWPADDREGGRGAGAPDVPGAVAAAAALRAVRAEAAEVVPRLTSLVEHLRARLPEVVPDIEVVGHPSHRLPHLVTFSCLYLDGEALLTALDRKGFAVSSGSSCTSSTLEPSHVLAAMGVLTHGNIRVSLHRETTRAQVEEFLAVLGPVVARLRATAGVAGL